MVNAIYDAVVTHTRRAPQSRFSHRMYLWLVDLDELPELPRWLRPFARFDGGGDLVEWLWEQGFARPRRIVMLAQARVLGYVFNPLTVYWCEGDEDVVVAEVRNTYGGMHRYLLQPDDHGSATADKEFYVSPFLPMHGQYRLYLPRPDEWLNLVVSLRQDGHTSLAATLRGRRRPASSATLVKMVVTRPFLPQRVSASIRWHGIGLWLRRVPVVPRKPAAADD
ncbi:DUF1365 domain-containing protein [Amycolatopsis sp.]|uniref:DUF1365 domain-containing protein n=1 Tax=Amycolatopsis sp. TaxID=37632 RepID=UPI002D01E45F|nr:DUF1365 domain-containing protein [Amycolatopsis sp.]HVV13898.1 DUF1365 domain-containing protein [Amycolatopsis sp.]